MMIHQKKDLLSVLIYTERKPKCKQKLRNVDHVFLNPPSTPYVLAGFSLHAVTPVAVNMKYSWVSITQ